MNRRQWLASSALSTGGIWISASGWNSIFVNDTIKKKTADVIEEIHLINLSHHDYGYTDLPSSVWDYQVNNTRLALRYIEETAGYPDEAKFHWTEEGLWGVERFWNDATDAEKRQFATYVRTGLIEVTVMPGNMTCLMDRYEWENEINRLRPFIDMFNPKVALQNDINGLPWGIVDSLIQQNVKWVTMASNDYLSGAPLPKPSFFWWQGYNGQKLLMFNGHGYTEGYFYFHEKEWRRGPVPNRYDIWFNRPSGNEIFSTDPDELEKSHHLLIGKLSKLIRNGYAHSILPLSVTNMWTIDNDVPCRQLSEFIKTWNEKGYRPKLVFSTPSMFMNKISQEIPENLPVLKGEWCDWWASGIANSPFEVAVLQAAKRRNIDIGRMVDYFKPLGVEDIQKQLEELNRNLVFCSEHTWGAYDSIARPYSERTQGNHSQKFDYFFRCDEDSKRIKAEVIRNSSFYKPLSQTSYIEVVNPGSLQRSGWVDISAIALRRGANGVRDVRTGEFFPFDKMLASDWIPKEEGLNSQADEIPNDVWPYRQALNRFHLSNLQPGEKRKFELVEVSNVVKRKVDRSRFYRPIFDPATGVLTNINYRPNGKMLFDQGTDALPAQLVIERPKGEYIRDDINSLNADPQKFHYNVPVAKKVRWSEGLYAMCLSVEFEESFAKKIIQDIHFFDSIPKIEITTTIWLKENLDPIAVYLAFPFSIKSPSAYYNSFGNPVEVGVDQLENTCGIYNTVQNGVIFKGSDHSIALTTLDAPLGIFERLERFRRRPVFKPKTAHFYSLLCENYWITNFAALEPAKCIFRHIIECDDANSQPALVENVELWAYPASH